MSNVSSIPLQPAADISPADALWAIIRTQSAAVRKVLAEKLLAEQKAIEITEQQEKMVRESLAKAFEELDKGMAKPDARSLRQAGNQQYL
ncbi:MAG: hypothetical protein IJV34_02125 [Prevotella sp.]|nr:hypothetical protein [Prevotella sp.]